VRQSSWFERGGGGKKKNIKVTHPKGGIPGGLGSFTGRLKERKKLNGEEVIIARQKNEDKASLLSGRSD